MLGRHVYRVSETDADWHVTKDGEEKPRGRFRLQEDAMRAACDLAAADAPSRVTVENRDGTLGEERIYGTDPAEIPMT